MPKDLQDISPIQQESDALRHDLRTHISAIISLAEMVKKKPEGGNSSHLLDALQLAAGNALAIMDGTLNQREPSVDGSVNMLKVIEDFELLAQGLIQSSGAKLTIDIAKALSQDPNCYTDQVQLHRVLMLLLDNAFQYAPGADITFSAQRNKKNEIVLHLCDCGEGFGAEDLELLFMPYHRGNKHRNIHGTGLGLWSARNIVNLLGGTIQAKNNNPHGACFVITLPEEPPNPGQMGGANLLTNQQIAKGKILIVDDNKTNHLILGEMLKSLGYEPTHCLSGTQALKKLAEQQFDLAFIDIRMNVMDGWELARQIRKMLPDTPLPLIALSADDEPAKLNHFALWIQRPIRPSDLTKTLHLTSLPHE